MNPINTNTSGYQAAKANAAALGAKLVSYFETEDMAATTITSDSKKPQTLQELQSYITEKYGVNRADKTIEGIPATLNVSPTFLQEALKNPEKMQWLEENLQAMQSLNSSMFAGTLTQVSYSIDAKGEITMITSGSSDPDGRIAKENASRKQEEQRLKEKQEQNQTTNATRGAKSLGRISAKSTRGETKWRFSFYF
ncbi:hypothetical protein [Helicobacter sp. UBA3407]|uniref:hypothetical protein n=1 Tax=Helicobacter sp. UBA3407 TaxID=1946588 RepID=UPI002620D8B1|nr:hypothetical protein [Helicobacter sp. UBA3407]